ncbi:MAG: DUF721 domain-containing protein [Chitinivibrionales bacterium]|nr:DUF721 domain-containing protein [Chitinivibrionales bacterium]
MMRKSKPESITQILNSFLSEQGYLTACREYDVVRMWPEIVGEKIAENTQCTRAEDGVLYVRVPSAAWRQEISYLKKEILDKIEEKSGCSSIKEIIFY